MVNLEKLENEIDRILENLSCNDSHDASIDYHRYRLILVVIRELRGFRKKSGITKENPSKSLWDLLDMEKRIQAIIDERKF